MHYMLRCFLMLIPCACLGCGAEVYEQRLQATREFYAHLEEIDSNLAPAWDRRDFGMAMRPPLPFNATLAPPAQTVDEEGNVFVDPDARQPHVLGIDLPGLVDAWQTFMQDDAGNQVEAMMYVLSNHERWLLASDGGLPPEEFLDDLTNQLSDAFDVIVPAGEVTQPDDNARFRQFVPLKGSSHAKYVVPKDFLTVRYVPEGTTGGQDLQGLLYLHSAGEVQVAVFFICPKSITSQFRQRIELALQTLQVNPQAPKPSNTPGGGPATSGAGSAF